MIEETVPNYMLGIFGTSTNLAVNGGKMLTFVMGAGLPDSKDKQAAASTHFWRVIFALPWAFQAI